MTPQRPSIEVRWATLKTGRQEFDEIVATDARVHLEKMDDQEFSLLIETRTERAWFRIFTKNGRAHLDAEECWRDVTDPHLLP